MTPNRYQITKLVRQPLSLEVKFYDQYINANPVTANAGWKDLTATAAGGSSFFGSMTQGTGPSDRIGRRIMVVGYEVRICVSSGGASPFYVGPFRLQIIQDKQCNGVPSAPNLIYADATQWASGMNLLDEGRYKVLKNYWNSEGGPTGSATVAVRFAAKCRIKVEYTANSGTTGDISGNNMQLMFAPSGITDFAFIPRISIRVLFVDA